MNIYCTYGITSKIIICSLHQMALYVIGSTLTALIFLHYRVATKMALEILGYPMCRVRL